MLSRAPSPAAQRQRRKRERERRCEHVVQVTVSNDGIQTLVDLGWLGENESEDLRQIGHAISAMFADVVHHMKNNVTP